MSWAQELCIFMFVWMAKFGAAYGVRTGIHVGVDVAINAMNDRTRGWFVIFGLLAGAFFTGDHRHLRRAVRAGRWRAPTRPRPTSSCRSGSSTFAFRSART